MEGPLVRCAGGCVWWRFIRYICICCICCWVELGAAIADDDRGGTYEGTAPAGSTGIMRLEGGAGAPRRPALGLACCGGNGICPMFPLFPRLGGCCCCCAGV